MATISTCFTITPTSRLLTFTAPPFHKPFIFPQNRRINKRGWALVVPRAAVDVGRGIRPGGVVESDKLSSDVRKRTMDAVDGCGGRVTVGDVASRAGLKLNEAQKALQALAADTDGFLEVSEEGDVLYVFPKNYRSKLGAKSFRIKAEPFIEKAKGAGEYLIRVSFGTALIASIVIVYTAIIALVTSSRSEDDNRGRRGGRSYDSGFNFYFNPVDLFWYWDPYYNRRRRVQVDDNKTNFIESVFSFVFGDGDPNQGIEEERWKLIGQYIASNGGVVAAEELAPYLDIDSTERIKMSDNILDFTVPQDTNLNASNELSDERESNAEHDVQSTGNTSNKRSSVWEHFTEVPGIGENGKKKAKCNYCPQLIVISGTSGMWTHLGRCTKYNNGDTQGTQSRKRRKIVKKGQVVSSPSYSKFDQEACRAQLVRTFVCAELPFRFVEHEEFRKLLIILQPQFDIPSRYTLRRDIWALYIEELGKLKKVLKNCGRVSLTTDTWTSNQNLSYMSLTVHFVDRELKLHKKIINFCQITGHTGDMLGKYVDTYLRDWGLYGKILTVTVDNAKANDVMIRYLHNMMGSWDNHVLNGDYVHMRCCTHVLNLIVKSGLKEDKQGSISKIRHAVKWVKSSPSRLEKFMICASDEKIPYKGAVVLDVDTRWNSMYSMLTVALKYRKAFHKLSVREVTFRREMEEKTTHGITDEDWDYVESVLPLLELFYKSTIRLSGSLYVTSASYMAEVFTIGKGINKHMSSTNKYIMETANKMKIKFNKYWGDPDTLNILLLIAFVLDPRAKLHFAEFYIDLLYASTGKAKHLKDKLMSDFRKIYVQYGGTDYSQSSLLETRHEKDDDDIWCHYSQETGHVSDSKNEIEEYLKEARMPYKKEVDFDILGWWKANLTRYPILASIAREVLAIPASTVASESAFSTGGRVVSDYRTCLTPKMVEALVCTQDWLKGKALHLFSEEDLDEIHRLEKEITSQESVHLDD